LFLFIQQLSSEDVFAECPLLSFFPFVLSLAFRLAKLLIQVCSKAARCSSLVRVMQVQPVIVSDLGVTTRNEIVKSSLGRFPTRAETSLWEEVNRPGGIGTSPAIDLLRLLSVMNSVRRVFLSSF
jgi:hypothetical protein